MWVDNQGIKTKLFDKEILFEFENITLCDQEINIVRIDDPPKILGTQFIHNLIYIYLIIKNYFMFFIIKNRSYGVLKKYF